MTVFESHGWLFNTLLIIWLVFFVYISIKVRQLSGMNTKISLKDYFMVFFNTILFGVAFISFSYAPLFLFTTPLIGLFLEVSLSGNKLQKAYSFIFPFWCIIWLVMSFLIFLLSHKLFISDAVDFGVACLTVV